MTHGQYQSLGETRGTLDYGGAPLVARGSRAPGVGLHRAWALSRDACRRRQCALRGQPRIPATQPLGPVAGSGRAGGQGQGLSAGRAARPKGHRALRRAGATAHRARADSREGSHGEADRRADRRGRAPARSRRSTITSSGCSCGTWPAPRPTISTTTRSAATRRGRCISSSTSAGPKRATASGIGAPARRQTLPETVHDFLSRRLLDAEFRATNSCGGGRVRGAGRSDDEGRSRTDGAARLHLTTSGSTPTPRSSSDRGSPGSSDPTAPARRPCWKRSPGPSTAFRRCAATRTRCAATARPAASRRGGDARVPLGAHEYAVTRGLYGAELRQDGQVVANSLKAVTEQARAHAGNDARRVLQHVLHGPEGAGGDGVARARPSGRRSCRGCSATSGWRWRSRGCAKCATRSPPS